MQGEEVKIFPKKNSCFSQKRQKRAGLTDIGRVGRKKGAHTIGGWTFHAKQWEEREMRNSLIAMALALSMLVPLTACGGRDSGNAQNNATTPNTNNSAGANTGNGAGGNTDNGTGANGEVPGSTNGASAGQVRRYQQGGYVGADVPGGSRGSNIYGDVPGNPQRSAPSAWESNPYLRDGRYRADGNGAVEDRDSTGQRDLTQDARDMIRDAGDALKDMGRGVGNAVDDMTGAKNGMNGQ